MFALLSAPAIWFFVRFCRSNTKVPQGHEESRKIGFSNGNLELTNLRLRQEKKFATKLIFVEPMNSTTISA